jgi:hypothetical protein
MLKQLYINPTKALTEGGHFARPRNKCDIYIKMDLKETEPDCAGPINPSKERVQR